MAVKSLIIFAVMFQIVCQAKHIHPGGINPDEMILEEGNVVETIIPIDIIRNIKPTRFVPLNSVTFFQSHEPCEDGFQRDVLGICREVWD